MPSRETARALLKAQRLRLLLLALAVFFVASACSSLTSPDRETGREYSIAFADWFYQSNSVQIEAARVQEALVEAGDEDALQVRLRELATTQTNLNARFTEMTPHPFWAEYHPGIVEAAARFDAATAHLREEGSFGPIDPLVEQFRFEEAQLLQAVITCYTQSGPCPAGDEEVSSGEGGGR